MHTLTIAGSFETAESVAKFYALREVSRPNEIVLNENGRPYFGFDLRKHGYDWTDPYGAIVALRNGRHFNRIIIANDWLLAGNGFVKWRGLGPGEWVTLWRHLQDAVQAGTQRVWS